MRSTSLTAPDGATLIVQGKDLAALRKKLAAEWPAALRTLLQIAAGWLYFGPERKGFARAGRGADVALRG